MNRRKKTIKNGLFLVGQRLANEGKCKVYINIRYASRSTRDYKFVRDPEYKERIVKGKPTIKKLR